MCSVSQFPAPVTAWTVACQASLSMDFPGKNTWVSQARNGLLFPSSGDLPNPGIEPESPTLLGRFFTTEPPGKPKEQTVLSEINEHGGRVTSFSQQTLSLMSSFCLHWYKLFNLKY